MPLVRRLLSEAQGLDGLSACVTEELCLELLQRTGAAPDANSIPVPKENADLAMDAAQCIGCGACVAACKNASAMLFVAAKASHLGHLPQGQVERLDRAKGMVKQMDAEGFGTCSNYSQCEAACPKEISVKVIAELNRDLIAAQFKR